MGQPTGQRVQLLTFSGSVYVSQRKEFNSSNGVPTQTGSISQELSGDSASDAVTARETAGSVVVDAAATFTLTGQPADTQTITVASKTWTFQTSLTNVDGNVLIGASASDSLDNLIAAIRLGAGAGAVYAALTTTPGEVIATAGAGDTMLVEGDLKGSDANSYAISTTIANGNWGGRTVLEGGLFAEDTNGFPSMTATTS